MEKLTLLIEGMHCAACELRVEEAALGVEGVNVAKASLAYSSLTVSYDANKTSRSQIERAIAEAGYAADTTQSDENRPRSHNHTLRLIGILVVLLGIYMLISHAIGFNFIPDIEPGAGFGVIFLIGVLTSLHCLAMCGGINLSQNVSQRAGSARTKLLPGLKYNAGRVLSYALIGGIVGSIGSVISFSGTAKGIVMFVAGLLMLLMGLNMLGLRWLARLKLHMPKALVQRAGALSKGRPFVVGLLNGLMPCGPLQAMQLYALSTGSFVLGALSMLMFALGTVPLMFLFGAISAFLSSRFTRIIGKVSAVLIVMIGFSMLGRGFGFTGIALAPAPNASIPANAAVVSGDVQEITSVFSSGSYVPITVKEGIPVVWTIRISEKDINGCNNPVIIPAYGIEKKLIPGDNVIEFVPSEAGVFAYSCWMSMIRSSITVTGTEEQMDADAAPTLVPELPDDSGWGIAPGSGCCG